MVSIKSKIINTFKGFHIEKILFFNNFRSLLSIGLRDPVVSWVKVFVTNIGGFQLLVIVTKDLVWDVVGVLYPLLFNHICSKMFVFWIFGVKIY